MADCPLCARKHVLPFLSVGSSKVTRQLVLNPGAGRQEYTAGHTESPKAINVCAFSTKSV